MSYKPSFSSGDFKAVCDVCGRVYKASALRQRWDGLMCCMRGCWEIRQPQDFVRGVADVMKTPWSRPEPSNYFIPVGTTLTETFSDTLTFSEEITITII